MNSTTIIAYIAKLAKENKNLKMEIDTIKQRNVELREVIAMLRYREDCDAESVASNESGESGESGYEVTSDHYLPVITRNTELSRLFHKLTGKEDNEFKKKAYMRAAHVIKDFPIELMNSAQIAHINGIGKGITKLVDEYMNTGTFKKLRA
jgi:hypothetical protein|tara:strand:+ start:3545 stop:3997 length:453 start_codon:yes stop_codon:yes gene_type:complete